MQTPYWPGAHVDASDDDNGELPGEGPVDSDRDEGEAGSNDEVIVTGATDLTRDHGWAIVTHLVYPEDSSALLLKHQNSTIQMIVQHSIKNVRYNIFFVDAFPDSRLKIKFSRDALHKAASDLGFRDVSNRLSRDLDYVTTLAELVGLLLIFHLSHANVFDFTSRRRG